MALKPQFPDYQPAYGRFVFYQMQETIKAGLEPRLEHCPHCDAAHKLHWYGVGWCDECAIGAGYLPTTAHEDADLLLFRAMFAEMRNKGLDWEQIRHVVKWWSVNRRTIMKGDFSPMWLHEALTAPAVHATCAWPGCGQLLGKARIKEYCGTTCYQRAYRRDNKEEIALRKLIRSMPKSREDFDQ